MRVAVIGVMMSLVMVACDKQDTTVLKPTDADQFIAQVNAQLLVKQPLWSAADWVAATNVTDDTQRLSAAATAEELAFGTSNIDQAKRYNGLSGLQPDTSRALLLIKLGSSMPSPREAAQRAELARLSAKLEAGYSSARWCNHDAAGNQQCLALPDIEKIIDNVGFTHTPAEMADAWAGWHATAKSAREDYQQMVALMNEGARDVGYADTGELWRGGYDMMPTEFAAEVERLWRELQPLYEQLHCAVRSALNKKYGETLVPQAGLIPAHLLGNMWAQSWSNLYPLLAPYPKAASLDVSSALRAQREHDYQLLRHAFKGQPSVLQQADMAHAADLASAQQMTRIAEDFYTSLGMPTLPDSFWTTSLLLQPRDRVVECHASAWNLNFKNDVRIKLCIEPNADQLETIHHELGHIYYYLLYQQLPPLFQSGAHDGFHEAIGDTITLSLTPAHLQKIGLAPRAPQDQQSLLNAQMKLALDKIAFLPFGKLVDQWRWQAFSGTTKPEHYNEDWWTLRQQYQGIAPPIMRAADDFDAGAKYHVAANTPYTRYFLSFVLQFQFHKALCEAAGFKGPLAQCDIYGNKVAGEKYMAMLSAGASQPWQDTLQKLTGTRQMDAAALIEYFQPLMQYLREKNKGLSCGWPGELLMMSDNQPVSRAGNASNP